VRPVLCHIYMGSSFLRTLERFSTKVSERATAPISAGRAYEKLCFLLICSYHCENILLIHYNVAIAVELVDYRKVQRLSEYSGQIPGLESRKLKTVGLLPGTRARKDG
jgi:hypothetical protein